MIHILADILSLAQYLKTLREESDHCCLACCGHCGRAGPWHHGHYHRKADRSPSSNPPLNPIPIFRFFCPQCRRTSSALPECLPPRRWYLWEIQQAVFLGILMGKSLYAVAQSALPSRRTMSRWIQRFRQQFQRHQEVLRPHVLNPNLLQDFPDFWSAVLQLFSLGQAMRLCHAAGVEIP
jgi:Domain of unknown function (DUF6431)